MSAIADAGPLRYLILIEEVDLLAKLYAHLVVPVAVLNELSQPSTPPLVSSWMSNRPVWLEVAEVSALKRGLPAALGEGERQAITLAEMIGADVLLIDDGAARREAVRRQLQVQGTLGVLATAAGQDLIDLPSAIQRLRRTNFRVSERLLKAFLEQDAARRSAGKQYL